MATNCGGGSSAAAAAAAAWPHKDRRQPLTLKLNSILLSIPITDGGAESRGQQWMENGGGEGGTELKKKKKKAHVGAAAAPKTLSLDSFFWQALTVERLERHNSSRAIL